MIPVLVDGVKKYLLTEEEVDAKISASSGGSSSENELRQLYFVFDKNEDTLPTDPKYANATVFSLGSADDGSGKVINIYSGSLDENLLPIELTVWKKDGAITGSGLDSGESEESGGEESGGDDGILKFYNCETAELQSSLPGNPITMEFSYSSGGVSPNDLYWDIPPTLHFCRVAIDDWDGPVIFTTDCAVSTYTSDSGDRLIKVEIPPDKFQSYIDEGGHTFYVYGQCDFANGYILRFAGGVGPSSMPGGSPIIHSPSMSPEEFPDVNKTTYVTTGYSSDRSVDQNTNAYVLNFDDETKSAIIDYLSNEGGDISYGNVGETSLGNVSSGVFLGVNDGNIELFIPKSLITSSDVEVNFEYWGGYDINQSDEFGRFFKEAIVIGSFHIFTV